MPHRALFINPSGKLELEYGPALTTTASMPAPAMRRRWSAEEWRLDSVLIHARGSSLAGRGLFVQRREESRGRNQAQAVRFRQSRRLRIGMGAQGNLALADGL